MAAPGGGAAMASPQIRAPTPLRGGARRAPCSAAQKENRAPFGSSSGRGLLPGDPNAGAATNQRPSGAAPGSPPPPSCCPTKVRTQAPGLLEVPSSPLLGLGSPLGTMRTRSPARVRSDAAGRTGAFDVPVRLALRSPSVQQRMLETARSTGALPTAGALGIAVTADSAAAAGTVLEAIRNSRPPSPSPMMQGFSSRSAMPSLVAPAPPPPPSLQATASAAALPEESQQQQATKASAASSEPRFCLVAAPPPAWASDAALQPLQRKPSPLRRAYTSREGLQQPSAVKASQSPLPCGQSTGLFLRGPSLARTDSPLPGSSGSRSAQSRRADVDIMNIPSPRPPLPRSLAPAKAAPADTGQGDDEAAGASSTPAPPPPLAEKQTPLTLTRSDSAPPRRSQVWRPSAAAPSGETRSGEKRAPKRGDETKGDDPAAAAAAACLAKARQAWRNSRTPPQQSCRSSTGSDSTPKTVPPAWNMSSRPGSPAMPRTRRCAAVVVGKTSTAATEARESCGSSSALSSPQHRFVPVGRLPITTRGAPPPSLGIAVFASESGSSGPCSPAQTISPLSLSEPASSVVSPAVGLPYREIKPAMRCSLPFDGLWARWQPWSEPLEECCGASPSLSWKPTALFETFRTAEDLDTIFATFQRLYRLALLAPKAAVAGDVAGDETVAETVKRGACPPPWSQAQHRRFPFEVIRVLLGGQWRAKQLWEKLDARCSRSEYLEAPCSQGRLQGRSVVIVGAGPAGLRAALELALLGAKVTVLEKREKFTRLNRLHLWHWCGEELKAFGARCLEPPPSDFGVDPDLLHIGISELQTLLLKTALLLGVQIVLGADYERAVWDASAQCWCVAVKGAGCASGGGDVGLGMGGMSSMARHRYEGSVSDGVSTAVPPSASSARSARTTSAVSLQETPVGTAVSSTSSMSRFTWPACPATPPDSPPAGSQTTPRPQPQPAPAAAAAAAAAAPATGNNAAADVGALWIRDVAVLIGAGGLSCPVPASVGMKSSETGCAEAIGLVANFAPILPCKASATTAATAAQGATLGDRSLRSFSLARQFYEPLFRRLCEDTGADLENFVYTRSKTSHYFVMTPRSRCLVECGVLRDPSAKPLLHPANVNTAALDRLVRRVVAFRFKEDQDSLEQVAAHCETSLSYADAGPRLFDFSKMRRSEDGMAFVSPPPASVSSGSPRVEASSDKELLVALAGDCLVEPFWPEGLGVVRGFFGALDVSHAATLWSSGASQEEVKSTFGAAFGQLKSLASASRRRIIRDEESKYGAAPWTRYRAMRGGA
eukprot:TRINITY_DN22041_c0_g2_i2.p1 TRINITY_DN22041_c0_g2~~TRINITY_DN22041_c0_g2_i2.p1  ORF type:complete len:1287 (-),score=292.47 TRINITY_DN22041_c0_g2_i2:194-4054(-)